MVRDPATGKYRRTRLFVFTLGYSRDLPFVQRAITHLQRTQEDDGSWYGRWGVNYIYGTWQVLRGLRSIGLDMRADWIQRGRDCVPDLCGRSRLICWRAFRVTTSG